jgi:hypothetical protein
MRAATSVRWSAAGRDQDCRCLVEMGGGLNLAVEREGTVDLDFGVDGAAGGLQRAATYA